MNKDGKVESGKCLFSLYEGSNDIWKTDIQTRKKHMKVKSGSENQIIQVYASPRRLI